MSGTVDTRTVEMRFDNSNFESNVKTSMSTLEKLKRALKLDGASAGLREVEKASKKLEFKDFKRNIDDVGKRFSVLEAIATGALLKIGASAAEAGMRMAKSLTIDQIAAGWDKYAEKTTAVQTIMANLRDDEGEFIDEASKMDYINGYLNKLLWFSDETSYSFTDMTSNVGKFIAQGQGLEDSVTAMQGIATWAAMSGQNAQAASRAMYNISQALGVGSMKVKDWMSIENANMATSKFKELAITVGQKQGKIKEGQVTIENFRESLSGSGTNGWFDKEVMMEVFKTYGDAADKIQVYSEKTGKTATEIIRDIRHGNEKIEKEVGVTADSIGFKALMAAQEAKTFGEVVTATADAVSTKWLRIFENIFGNYLQAKELWTDLANDLWEIFAGPLDTIGEIMDAWNQGFFKDGPQNILQKWFATGKLDDLENGLEYVSKATAELAVASDKATYKIETLEDGSMKLVKLVETSPGVYTKFTKKIYDADKDLLSGRDLLVDGFRNILRTFIFDWEDADGEMHLSLFSTIKDGLKEVIFGTSDMEEIIPRVTRKLWEMTKRFNEFSKKLLPTEETLGKIKNAFKGLFTLFKMGGKLIKAIAKPFINLFKNVFKGAPKTILNLADSIGTWTQKLDDWLAKNKIFDKISSKLSGWIDKIRTKIDKLSISITGLPLKDLVKNLKDKVFGFFENYDFKGTYDKVIGFFSGIIQEIKDVFSDDLPEKLTPLQKFLNTARKIFSKIGGFFQGVITAFQTIKEAIRNAFSTTTEPLEVEGIEEKVSAFQPIWDAIASFFSGIKDFFISIGPTLSKIGEGFGNFFRNLGQSIASWSENKTPDEIIKTLAEGGFLIYLAKFIGAITKLLSGGTRISNALVGDLKAVKKVLKAYAREINASTLLTLALTIGALAGSMWVLAQIPEEDMDRAANALIGIAAAVAAAMFVISKIKGSGKNVAEVTKPLESLRDVLTATIGASIFANDWTAKLVKISLSILFVALAAKKIVDAVGKLGEVIVQLADLPPEKVKAGGKIAAQIITAFGMFALLAGLGRTASAGLFAAVGAYVLVLAIRKVIDVLADLGSDETKMDNIQKVVDRFGYVFETIKAIGAWALKIAAALTVAELIIAAFSTGKEANTLGMSKVMKQFGKNFLRVAAAMLIVGAAFALLAWLSSQTDPKEFDNIKSMFENMYIMIGLLQTISIGLVSYGKNNGAATADLIKQFGKNFIRIAASLLIVSAAFALMSTLKFPNTGFGAIALVFGVFIALAGFMSLVALKASSLKKSEYFAKTMKSISTLFLAVAGSFVIVAAAFAIMSSLNFEEGEMLHISIIFGVFAVVVAGLAVLGSQLGKTAAKAKNLATTIGSIAILFLSVSGSFVIVAAAFAIMSALDFEEGEMWEIAKIFGVFAIVVAAFAGLGFLIGKFGKWEAIQGIGAMALEMVAAAVSIGIVARAFSVLAKNASVDQMKQAVEIIKWFGIVVGALSLVGALAGGIGGPMAIGGMLAIAGIILSIGAACLMAGIGIGVAVVAFGLFADALADLIAAVAQYGPEFSANIEEVLKSVLEAIISNAPLFVEAGAAIIDALAAGVAKAVKSVGSWIKQTATDLWTSIKESFDYEIDEHGFRIEPEVDTKGASEAGTAEADAQISAYEQRMAELKSETSALGTSKVQEPEGAAEAASESGTEAGTAYWESYAASLLSGSSGLDLTKLNFSNITGGIANFSELFGIDSIDISSFTSMLSGAFDEIDISSLWGGKASDLLTSIQTSTSDDITPAVNEMASAIETPITSLDSSAWGADIGSGLASGIRSEIGNVSSAAYELAQAVAQYIHFSEPEKGPLSDFHTFAPDMIKLWNKGIYDNIGSVKESSISVADTVYDGFSTALDYVSDLIDNGMSDQLTIRPIMDLSEIQNGMNSMSGMLSSADGYQITGTTRLAASAAYGIGVKPEMQQTPQIVQSESGPITNTFYITNNDPNTVAEKVSKILGNQTRRQKAVWGYK